MSLHTEKMIRHIINHRLNEKATLDYKVQEYSAKKFKDEALKDVIAMLNSKEALAEDKYILFGVNDKKMLLGLDSEFRDDNEYQSVFNNINPRPSIETGTIEIEDKLVGYINIKKENNEWPYEIGKDTDKYTSGTSFIRIGSTTSRMTQQQRDELTLIKYDSSGDQHPSFREIEKRKNIKDKIFYTDVRNEGTGRFNPSLNNGKYTIGEGLNEFVLKFDVPNNDVARIYNNHNLHVARIKNESQLWDELERIKPTTLNFNSRFSRFTYDDLIYIMNNKGKEMILKITQVDSESHGRPEDKIVFEWKILM